MKNAMTLSDILSDLRAVSDVVGRGYLRSTMLDDNGAALLELGLVEPVRVSGQGVCLCATDDGLDVLFACRDVVLPEAA